MTTTIQALQFNDKITLRRQAQKDDLVDIARALGLAVTSNQALPFLREKLTSELTRIAKAEGRGEPSWKGVNGKQVTKGELYAYLLALDPHTILLEGASALSIRAVLRLHLTRRAERIEADRKWNETEDAAAAEFNAREAEFAALPAAEVATLTAQLTHQEANLLLSALDQLTTYCMGDATNPIAQLTMPQVATLRAKLADLLPTAG